MAKSVGIIGVMLLLLACGNSKKVTPPAVNELKGCQEGIAAFLHAFEKDVQEHDQQKVLQAMDEIYRKEQHDEFLEGRTEQFLNEFFSGQNKGGEWINVTFQEVKDFRFLSCREVDADWRVYGELKYKGQQVLVSWRLQRDQITGNFGLVGAMG